MEKLLCFLIACLISVSLNAQTNSVVSDNSIRRIVELQAYYDSEECDDLKTEKKLVCAEKAMYAFIYSNLNYPEEALASKLEGTVVIRLVVEKDGSLSNFQIRKNPGKGCGREALRVVQLLDTFVPAQLKQVAVRSYYELSIKFDATLK